MRAKGLHQPCQRENGGFVLRLRHSPACRGSFQERETQLREGREAMAEYNANRFAIHEKTARLRALRLDQLLWKKCYIQE